MTETETLAEIHDLSTDGRGVAKLNGDAYFIAGTFPGDRARVALDKETEPFSATVLELLVPSPHRVSHPCPHANECPASPWGKLVYDQQLAAKQRLVVRTLKRAIGEVEVLPTVPSPEPWHYRNRLNLTVWKEDGYVGFGYQTGPREESGVPIHTCKLGSRPLDTLLDELAFHLRSQEIPDDVLPRRIQLHETTQGAGVMLAFSRYPTNEIIKFWTQDLKSLPIPGGIWMAQGTRVGVVAHGMRVTRATDARSVATTWLGHILEAHPAAFTQANSQAGELVHRRLRLYGEHEQFESVWDLYGGYGALGFALAGSTKSVTVVDVSSYAQQTFQELTEVAANRKSRFMRGDLLTTLPPAAKEITENDIVVLDPPRSGVHPEVLTLIARSRCRYIVYLSCNPARLGRDLKHLKERGFSPVEIQPYDFFPQTPAIETLAILRR